MTLSLSASMGVDAAELSRLKRAMKKMGKVFGKAKARRNIAGAISKTARSIWRR